MATVVGRCLNCEAELCGPFCASCGQRAVPTDPTVKELAGDAWQELTGYDGRIAATLRGRLFTTMPRVFFAMLPVFAAILALFYRGRRFPTHLVFAAHVHAFAFVALTLAEAVKFSRNDIVQATFI